MHIPFRGVNSFELKGFVHHPQPVRHKDLGLKIKGLGLKGSRPCVHSLRPLRTSMFSSHVCEVNGESAPPR